MPTISVFYHCLILQPILTVLLEITVLMVFNNVKCRIKRRENGLSEITLPLPQVCMVIEVVILIKLFNLPRLDGLQ